MLKLPSYGGKELLNSASPVLDRDAPLFSAFGRHGANFIGISGVLLQIMQTGRRNNAQRL
jgi:hypothetical protein